MTAKCCITAQRRVAWICSALLLAAVLCPGMAAAARADNGNIVKKDTNEDGRTDRVAHFD